MRHVESRGELYFFLSNIIVSQEVLALMTNLNSPVFIGLSKTPSMSLIKAHTWNIPINHLVILPVFIIFAFDFN